MYLDNTPTPEAIQTQREFMISRTTHCLFNDPEPMGANACTGDPMFRDAENNDYRISRNSPAHDTGLYDEAMKEETDLAGNPRVDRKQLVDIGCYETPYAVPGTTFLVR